MNRHTEVLNSAPIACMLRCVYIRRFYGVNVLLAKMIVTMMCESARFGIHKHSLCLNTIVLNHVIQISKRISCLWNDAYTVNHRLVYYDLICVLLFPVSKFMYGIFSSYTEWSHWTVGPVHICHNANLKRSLERAKTRERKRERDRERKRTHRSFVLSFFVFNS